MWQEKLGTLLIGIACVGVGSAAAQTYQLTDLGNFFPLAINEAGAMAGITSVSIPAVRMPDGEVIRISEIPGSAYQINESSQVLFIEDFDGQIRNYGVWSPDTGVQMLRTGEWFFGDVVAMNNAGAVVGELWLDNEGNQTCPARWNSPTSLPTCLLPPGSGDFAFDINNRGDVVTMLRQLIHPKKKPEFMKHFVHDIVAVTDEGNRI
jgi:hypothetical protein